MWKQKKKILTEIIVSFLVNFHGSTDGCRRKFGVQKKVINGLPSEFTNFEKKM